MKTYMFKKAISLVAAAILSMEATTGWSQVINIPTDNKAGWSINNNSTFQVNTWSVEGNTDGSGMVTPFLENWVYRNQKLPDGIWSYTVTGLTPDQTYVFSALVRAYNEGSNVTPGNVNLYAGSNYSSDISTGTTIYGNNTGKYGMLSVTGTADAQGQLKVGVRVYANSCNWVALKNATLTPYSPSSAVLYVLSPTIESGETYLITNAQSGDCYALTGSTSNNNASRAKTNASNNSVITSVPANTEFTVTGSNNQFVFYNTGLKKYIRLFGDSRFYDVNEYNIKTESSDKGFYLSRNNENRTYYLRYNNGYVTATNSNNRSRVYLFAKYSLSFDKALCSIKYGEAFTEPVLTKHPASASVTFSSSDTNVATVDANTGKVLIQGAGTAQITASCKVTASSTLSASYTLLVTPGEKSKPTLTLWFNGNASGHVVGTTGEIGYYYDGDGVVTFQSSNENVATVNQNGVVLGVSPGEVEFTATSSETNRYASVSSTLKITVINGYNPQSPNLQFSTVNGITTIQAGEQLNTTYSRDGNGLVTYASSDNSIATINERGVITGIGEGKVTLTATVAADGNYTAQSKSVEVTVTLKDPQLTFAAENGVGQIYVGDQLKTVVKTLSDASISYSSSNDGVASVDNKGVITGEHEGTATIKATILSEGAYSGATKSISVKVVKRKTTVEPSFTTKSIRVGGTTVLKLITESNGNQHFVSDNTAVATINATTGEITGIAEGTATIRYWVDASVGYEASEVGTVTVVVSSKPEPIVEVNPSSVSLAIGGRKDIVVNLGDYTGNCIALVNDESIAGVAVKSHDPENHTYVFSVTGLVHGETFITLALEETNTYLPMEIKVPVTVLNIYQYELVVKNAPINGVAIQIWGVTYTGSSIFNSSHNQISVTDVNVRYLPSYQSKVEISDRLITVTYSLREPAKGSFIRLKSLSSGKYATLVADGGVLTMAEKGLNNIIYYDEQGHFLFYKNGQYVKEVNKMAAVDEAANADVFSFTRGTGDYSECYSIQTTGGYLHGSSNGTSIGSTSGSEYAYWYVEMLESLPVSVSANGYGYASLYCPVELEVSGGLSAYYIDSKSDNHDDTHNAVVEYRLHLEQLFSVIPAKTPVILVGVPGTTYNCPIKYEPTQTAPVSADALTGHCAAQVSADVRGGGTIYALQASKSAESVGFYPWTKETLSGFKCYFIETNATPAPYYRFVFGEEGNSTGLSEPLIETAEESLVFNLQGQRVADTPENLPAGLYIVRGKKVIIK